jgi:kelch-like protein 20
MGGGNGVECFADVEMLVLDIGKWIPTRSLLQKVEVTACLALYFLLVDLLGLI